MTDTFLTRLYAATKAHIATGEPLTADAFAAIFRSARGAAGGTISRPKPKDDEALDMAESPACPEGGAAMDAEGMCPACDAGAENGAGGVVGASENPSDLADIAAQGHTHRLFHSIALAEAPAWISYLPKPGTYAHPRYGPITITTARNARFVDNFTNKVYQDRLPIDAEHETKLSGAVGWITALRQNTDGSADAQVEWTDRGRAFFKDDRFRYFSPEWYDGWEDPATQKKYQDVAIGGAICTRPFFKPPALRPLFASEGSLSIDPDEQPQGVDMPEETQSFAELQAQLDALKTENSVLKSASESATAQSTQLAEQAKQLAEQVTRMAAERQAERFTALIKNDGARWFGENALHLDVLGTLAQTYGEDAAQFGAYVAQQQAVAAALRTSAAFNEIGSDGGGKTESAEDKLDRQAKDLAREKNISVPQAYTELLAADPSLYAA